MQVLPTKAVALPAKATACAEVEAEDTGEDAAAPVASMQSSLQLRRHLHAIQVLGLSYEYTCVSAEAAVTCSRH